MIRAQLAGYVLVFAVGVLIGSRLASRAPSSVPGTEQRSAAGSTLRPSPAPSIHRHVWVVITYSHLNYLYKPQRLTVNVGAEVSWVNRTAESHTVTAARGGDFDTKVAPNQSRTLRFNRVGRYPYFCRFHPYMRAMIVVKS